MTGELPYGAHGDLAEALVPIAADLVHAVREGTPAEIRAVLARVPTGTVGEGEAELAVQRFDALAMVCAAMVNQKAGIKTLLDWTEPLLALEPIQKEAERLRAAGVTPATAATVAVAVENEPTTRERMLRVIHGERTA